MRVGFRVAEANGYDFLLQVDADGQHDARRHRAAAGPFDDEPGAQVVIGARFAGQDYVAVPGHAGPPCGFWPLPLAADQDPSHRRDLGVPGPQPSRH